MGFFSSEKKTNPDGTPITQIEKRREIGISNYPVRQRQISDSFGTTDLDYVLKAYAPEHVGKIDDMHCQINDIQNGLYKYIPTVYHLFSDLMKKIDKIESQNTILQEKITNLEKQSKTTSYQK